MRRAIEHFLEDPLSEELLKGGFTGKDTIMVKVHDVEGEKKLFFDATAGAAASAELVGAAGGPPAGGESKN